MARPPDAGRPRRRVGLVISPESEIDVLSDDLDFARGLIGISWVGLMFLGPLAYVNTWWADCFDETCPSPTVVDNAAYLFDLVAGITIAVLLIVVLFRPRRMLFVVLGGLAIAIAAQGFVGLLGSRGFAAFGIVLPAALLLLLGSIAGFKVMSGTAKGWMKGKVAGALALGMATILVAYVAFTIVVGGLSR